MTEPCACGAFDPERQTWTMDESGLYCLAAGAAVRGNFERWLPGHAGCDRTNTFTRILTHHSANRCSADSNRAHYAYETANC